MTTDNELSPNTLGKKYMESGSVRNVTKTKRIAEQRKVQNKVFAEVTKEEIDKKDEKDKDISVIFFTCYHCNEFFGLLSSFLERTSEIHFVYTCPYCSAKGRV